MTQPNLRCSFCGKPQQIANRIIASPNGDAFICDECVSVCSKICVDEKPTKKEDPIELLPPKEIKKKLDEYIVGQDEAKKVLSVAVYNHYKRINFNLLSNQPTSQNNDIELDKSNILMIGPTGTGKTLLAKTLAKILKVPFASCDATTLTEAGYVGDDVENILLKLIQNANYDIAKAERGIIYIDEIDKIARKTQNVSITRDVSGEGVQQALLKIIESTVASVPPQGGRKHPQQEMIQINTTNILFICGGAFVGLDKIIEKRTSDSSLGFGADVKSKTQIDEQEILQAQPCDLIKFGLIPEFVGRLPMVVGLHKLGKDALKSILTQPKNSLIKQYKKMFAIDGVNLEFEKSALDYVADKAIELKTGARGLKAILEDGMLPLMYEVPSEKGIEKIAITKDYLQKTKPAKITKKPVEKMQKTQTKSQTKKAI